jgi:hypothetical protein
MKAPTSRAGTKHRTWSGLRTASRQKVVKRSAPAVVNCHERRQVYELDTSSESGSTGDWSHRLRR